MDTLLCGRETISSIFSSNSEAYVSELLENIEERFLVTDGRKAPCINDKGLKQFREKS